MAKSTPTPGEKRDPIANPLALFQKGHFVAAAKICEKTLAKRPNESGALFILGAARLRLGLAEDAAELLTRAAHIEPNNPELHNTLGTALVECRRLDDSITVYRRAITLKPHFSQAHFNLGNALRRAARLADATAAYRAALALDRGYAAAHFNLAITLEAAGESEAAAAYTAAAENRPGWAEPLCGLARLLRQQGKLVESLAAYDRAAALEGAHRAEAQNGRGVVLCQIGRSDEAIAAFKTAIAADPNGADAHLNLGNALAVLHRVAEARSELAAAIARDPQAAEAYASLGHVERQAGRNDEAVAAYDRSPALCSDHIDAAFGRATARLLQGRFAEGWRSYLAREGVRHLLLTIDRTPLPRSLAGRRILLVHEQGLGEEIFFLRFARALKSRGAFVAFRSDPRLAAIFDRAAIVDAVLSPGDSADGFDRTPAIGDLPHLLGMNDGDPAPRTVTLTPRGEDVARMRAALAALGPPPYIGVSWRAGTTGRDHKLYKKSPRVALASVLRPLPATVVALQREPYPGEIAEITTALGRPVHDLSALNTDLETMLALVSVLDDYVAVSNTNVHLRAAAGRASRVVVPNPPEFRWMADGAESPWFPGTRLYRQAHDGSWTRALDDLGCDLLSAWSPS